MTREFLSGWMLLLPILLPAAAAGLVFLTKREAQHLQSAFALIGSGTALAVTILLFGHELSFTLSWAGFGMGFALRLYALSSLILLVAACSFLTVLYSTAFMKGRPDNRMFFGFMLLTSSFVSGAMLADNLVLMLFFWEGLLGLLFGMIMTGGQASQPTAIKAMVIDGTADLCLILGVCLVGWRAGTFDMGMVRLPLNEFWSNAAFLLMMTGAIAKAGSAPFHSWIPDAATDAPLPFMAFLPGALEKGLGVYLMARLSLELFELIPGSGLSLFLMTLGCCTIILMVLMALVQKDFKRLLSYHAISQVGYMILGIGTALPVGIVGGLFHMVNNAIYKSCLYYTAGNVEAQVGTTDLERLSGLGRQMPVTCAGFVIAALGIAGVPPMNGFFSKELIFDAAIEVNVVFYIVAAVGAFFTAGSFLKLGHTVFFGQPNRETRDAEEAPWQMLTPIIILAAACIVFGAYNPLPLKGFIEPMLGHAVEHTYSGLPHSWVLAGISVAVLLGALIHHRYGVKRSGRPLGAADHIHYAPGLKTAYGWAEEGLLDPYRLGGSIIDGFSEMAFVVDRAIDWIYVGLAAGAARLLAIGITRVHLGRHWLYVLWTVGGAVVVGLIFYVIGG